MSNKADITDRSDDASRNEYLARWDRAIAKAKEQG